MQRHAYLINVARGAIVDESALISALQNGSIAAPDSTFLRPSRCRRTAALAMNQSSSPARRWQ